MKIHTSELTGSALQWAIEKCEGIENSADLACRIEEMDLSDLRDECGSHDIRWEKMWSSEDLRNEITEKRSWYMPSSDWAHGGPIIERNGIAIWPDQDNPGSWFASPDEGRGSDVSGPSPLIAAMRCYVTSKLGLEVEVPEELAPTELLPDIQP